ncbi:MAG: LytTR family transcriptional regulator DNA-binding domain-containing protein [Chitinophagaceae bacterium]|nr:LytTR family transcriptional regulator DNA-binding domain-containing protein [Chitinophagaceae bacterium]MCW5926266.1 LytTR family transcriptional regulator DNA-binding domain-containing protein [Chitinophagaceae bacterium]
MIRVLIIDDELLARNIVREYLSDYRQVVIVQECSDGFDGVKAIMQHRPDLIFLDVQMPRINGFEMLELVESPPAVIFTTAFDEYAIKAFEAHAVDYLLKPFSKHRFDKALQKWLERRETEAPQTNLPAEATAQMQLNTHRVVVKTGGKIKIIPFTDIYYIEAADDYVKIHCDDGVYLKNKTMAYFEQMLDGSLFTRSHRSYIVNVQEITRLEPYEKESYLALLKSGDKVPVSKTGYSRLKQVLGL